MTMQDRKVLSDKMSWPYRGLSSHRKLAPPLLSWNTTLDIARTHKREAARVRVCVCVCVCVCDSLGLSVVAPTPASVKSSSVVVAPAEMNGSNGRGVVVSRDTDSVAVAAAAAGCVKLMTSALLPENRVIGAVLTDPTRFVVAAVTGAPVSFPVAAGSRSVNVIVSQLEVA